MPEGRVTGTVATSSPTADGVAGASAEAAGATESSGEAAGAVSAEGAAAASVAAAFAGAGSRFRVSFAEPDEDPEPEDDGFADDAGPEDAEPAEDGFADDVGDKPTPDDGSADATAAALVEATNTAAARAAVRRRR